MINTGGEPEEVFENGELGELGFEVDGGFKEETTGPVEEREFGGDDDEHDGQDVEVADIDLIKMS